MSYCLLHPVNGSYVVCLSSLQVLWLWQTSSVSFTIWHLWKLVQQHERVRDHLLGQELADMLPQLLDVDIFWRKVSH